ncbi:hypothetical protein [Curtobacterium sp. MCBD17_040]|nr:hypothetical protein [Curtobacterium sp. MCBD17_040]WIB65450.1 hypothetical protein DEI94_18940 [Curtobacterium sp. MCBD17_040]
MSALLIQRHDSGRVLRAAMTPNGNEWQNCSTPDYQAKFQVNGM